MLDRLLALLRDGGTHRVTDLAEILDTTPELVEMMLDDLARMGYLKPVSSGCGSKCKSCPMAGICAVGSGERIWSLTHDEPPQDNS